LGDVERVADRIGILVNGVLRVDCPTETFREQIKKIVLEFHGNQPENIHCPGLVSQHQIGSRWELVTIGFDDAQREAIEALEPHRMEILDLNLEDAFIEYTRGPRRSLPLFATEEQHGSSTDHQGAA
jgi:ABC-2 type transport system ATP-binding protein